jgi:hypothetical protein
MRQIMGHISIVSFAAHGRVRGLSSNVTMPKVGSKLVDTVLYGEGLVIKARLPGRCVGEETVVVLSFSRYLQAGQF